ncbi:hypothetical protein NM688_g2446 [Phlebia brevispora]|uniref:Uncharacterized protein n=1 Tax=Phlebia brevispora TaxID=194682 RepID=A0ACC1T8A8_9APHY|nr:hypothetical protein NM688_g2446 [Phlebia brevispora]
MVTTPFGEANEIPLNAFLEELLPPLHSSIQFDELLPRAGKSGISFPVAQNGRLWGYAANTPSSLKGLPTPDGRVDWTTIAIPGAYSKTKTKVDLEENITKITQCMSQCMYRDARRRFVYAFTAEDSIMRLWYCDRAQIVCSDTFDFVTNWRPLFQFLLRVMYAKRDELGFDPSISTLSNESGRLQYEITVRSTSGEDYVYHTLDVLSSGDSDILGRGTRVWKAIRIEDGKPSGEPVVVKDSWVSDRRDREGHINASIRESAGTEELKEIFDRSLLTVVAHGDVLIDGALDHTRVSLTQDIDLSSGSSASEEQDVLKTRRDRRLVHYRIVYKEVCDHSLDSISSLYRLFSVLEEACNGLRALHECGWVHRDISAGNILLYNDSIKIADLEYADRTLRLREYKHSAVGTASFIALEVKFGNYLFLPEPKIPNILEGCPPGFDVAKFYAENEEREARGEEPLPFPGIIDLDSIVPPPDFSYNPLHDLESLWWIAAFFIITRTVEGAEDATKKATQRMEAQRKLAYDLFSGRTKRYDVIQKKDYFMTSLSCLHPSLRKVAKLVESAREHLVTGYITTEKNLDPENLEIKHDVYTAFQTCFDAISSKLKDRDILVRRLERENHEGSS